MLFPADPFFIVLAIRQRHPIWLLILVGTLGVTLGGLLMYGIGYGICQTVGMWLIETYNWESQFLFLKQQLDIYGAWIIILKAFTPLPYKLMAFVAGVGNLSLFTFILASLIGRALRFSIEGFVLGYTREPFKHLLKKHLSMSLGIFFLLFLLLTFLMTFIFKL